MRAITMPMILSMLFITILLGVTIIFKPASANPAIILVPSGSKIQTAINNANPNDTILVEAGTYNENIVINKTVALKGTGQDVTFIKAADSSKAVIEIESNNVNLSGFTIQHGIVGVGLLGYNASTMSNNTIISNSNQGIYLQSSHHSTIANNTICLNKFEGVFLNYSTNNLISHNNITRNTNVGIDLQYSGQNQIRNNTISFHLNATLHNQGIWMDNSNNNTVQNNIISSNAYGIEMFSSNNDTIVGNILSGSQYGISLEESKNNTAHHNNFLYNKHQVESYESSNKWDNGTQGNYWTDYNGADLYHGPYQNLTGSDGIGDTPYLILDDNPDNFPLMKPWGTILDETPPTTTNDYDGSWRTANFYINLTAVDDTSGVEATYYRINSASSISNVSANGQPLINTEGANNTLEYWSVDGVGNEEKPHHNLTDIKLDKTPPSGSIQINNGEKYTTLLQVTLNLSATDLTSGIAEMRFSNNVTHWSLWENYGTSKAWDLTSGDGLKFVHAEYKDKAGLVSQIYLDIVILDTVAPIVSIISPINGSQARSSNVAIQWSGADAGAGVDHYETRLDNNPWINTGIILNHTFTGLTDGSHTVYVKAVDKTGHTGEALVSFTVNTSPIGGLGYLEEVAIILIAAVFVGIIVYILRVGKKRRLERESRKSNISVKTEAAHTVFRFSI